MLAAATEVQFHGDRGTLLALYNPVMTAAGCCGDCVRCARAGWLSGLGAAVTHSITIHARRGWPLPRVVEASAGVLYATGLPNPGLSATLRDAAPAWSGLNVPVIVSVAGETADDFATLATELEAVPGVAALELNFAWPGEEAATALVVTRVTTAVALATSLPILVKLSPAGETVAAAHGAEQGGADGVVIAHGWPARWFDPAGGADAFAGRSASLAGPAILPLGLGIVERVAAAVDIGVIACGGVSSAAAVAQYIAAGARAVQVGSALFRRPSIAAEIAATLAAARSSGAPP